MRKLDALLRSGACIAAALIAAGSLADLRAQTVPEGKAAVRATRGTVRYSTGEGVWTPVKVGAILKSGALIQTGADSSVDLFLSENGPIVRLSSDTTLSLHRLAFHETGIETSFDTQLNLKSGRILCHVRRIPGASRYEIKTPNGIAGIIGDIRGTDYDIRALRTDDGKDHTEIICITGAISAAITLEGEAVRAVVNAGEKWSPRTRDDRPVPALPDELDPPDSLRRQPVPGHP